MYISEMYECRDFIKIKKEIKNKKLWNHDKNIILKVCMQKLWK